MQPSDGEGRGAARTASGQAGRPAVAGRVKINLVRDDQQQRRGGHGQHARCRDHAHCHERSVVPSRTAKNCTVRPNRCLCKSTFAKTNLSNSFRVSFKRNAGKAKFVRGPWRASKSAPKRRPTSDHRGPLPPLVSTHGRNQLTHAHGPRRPRRCAKGPHGEPNI
jgi:hypothetical protein